VQDKFRLAWDDVILKFPNEFVPALAIKPLRALVERRYKQENVSAAGKVLFGKAKKL
jgi:hypothetical protein